MSPAATDVVALPVPGQQAFRVVASGFCIMPTPLALGSCEATCWMGKPLCPQLSSTGGESVPSRCVETRIPERMGNCSGKDSTQALPPGSGAIGSETHDAAGGHAEQQCTRRSLAGEVVVVKPGLEEPSMANSDKVQGNAAQVVAKQAPNRMHMRKWLGMFGRALQPQSGFSLKMQAVLVPPPQSL